MLAVQDRVSVLSDVALAEERTNADCNRVTRSILVFVAGKKVRRGGGGAGTGKKKHLDIEGHYAMPCHSLQVMGTSIDWIISITRTIFEQIDSVARIESY